MDSRNKQARPTRKHPVTDAAAGKRIPRTAAPIASIGAGKQIWEGGALLAPLPPIMVTCGTWEASNIITVAWTGIVNTHPPMTYISVRPSRHSYEIIRQSGEFALNVVPAALVKQADFCGMYTGRKVDKFKACGLHREPSQKLACPLIAESPLSLECRVTQVIPLGTHDMFLAQIVSASVADSLLDEKGRLHIGRPQLCAFAHGEYFEIGRKLADFGCAVQKKGGNKKTAKTK